jgi:prepilin-type N-terminal cleavage/methylation domain-containing protein
MSIFPQPSRPMRTTFKSPVSGRCRHGIGGRAGFTLLELILVMAILTIGFGLAAPALSKFFRGRSLDSEARRLYSLIRYGQERAVSEGVPMNLTLDNAQKQLLLSSEPSYEAEDPKKVDVQMDSEVQLEVLNTNVVSQASVTGDPWNRSMTGGTRALASSLPTIRLLPDGTIAESSPQVVRLTGRDGITLYVGQNRNRLGYEIREQAE